MQTLSLPSVIVSLCERRTTLFRVRKRATHVAPGPGPPGAPPQLIWTDRTQHIHYTPNTLDPGTPGTSWTPELAAIEALSLRVEALEHPPPQPPEVCWPRPVLQDGQRAVVRLGVHRELGVGSHDAAHEAADRDAVREDRHGLWPLLRRLQ